MVARQMYIQIYANKTAKIRLTHTEQVESGPISHIIQSPKFNIHKFHVTHI